MNETEDGPKIDTNLRQVPQSDRDRSNNCLDTVDIPPSCEKSLREDNEMSEKVEDDNSGADGMESDCTDTDYELESAIRYASKTTKHRILLEELGDPAIFALLSPSVREVTKHVELIRLVVPGSHRPDNKVRKELWPGVACGGAAIQCIHCRESGRHVISSLSLLWQHLGLLAYYHFSQCKKIPADNWQNLQALIPRFTAPNFPTFQTELGLLCQHVGEYLQENNSQISLPFVHSQTKYGLTRSKSKNQMTGGQGLRVMDLEKLVYQNGPNGKVNVIADKISNSACGTLQHVPPNGTSLVKIKSTENIFAETHRKFPQDIVLKKRPSTGSGNPGRRGFSLVMHLEKILHHENTNGHTSFVCEEIKERNSFE